MTKFIDFVKNRDKKDQIEKTLETLHKSYEGRLRELNLLIIEKEHLRQDMITMCNILDGSLNVENSIEFVRDTTTRGHSKKIRPSSVRLDVRKYTFFKRVWKTWNKLPEEAVSAPTLSLFKTRLENSRIFKG